MLIQSNDQLIEFISNGGSPKYVYFWGHQKSNSGVTKSCFSQWYEADFQENGVTFKTAEHYMMYHKAKLFGNEEIANKIIECNHPGEAKQLGRKVTGFDDVVWNNNRFKIVTNASKLKFGQNPELLTFLTNTGSRILVEASPVDFIWGIGLAADNQLAEDPTNWAGLNLLGYALMSAREQLA